METNLNSIDLKEKYLEQIINICEDMFSDENSVEIITFGSRVNETAHRASDINLAVKGNSTAEKRLGQFKEMHEESTVPYTVDVVLLSESDSCIKEKIEKKGILLWKN